MYYAANVTVRAVNAHDALRVIQIEDKKVADAETLEFGLNDEDYRVIKDEKVYTLAGEELPITPKQVHHEWFGYVGAVILEELNESTWEIYAFYND